MQARTLRRFLLPLACTLVALLAGVGSAADARPSVSRAAWAQDEPESDQPLLTEPARIARGVLLREAAIPAPGIPINVWIYLPERPPAGKLPCVLIAPAGSRMFHGMALAEGDRAEHLPYVRAGYAVVAYEVSGAVPDEPAEEDLITALRDFRAAQAGVANARAALKFALANVREIDPNRIYTAGHSSAATISLVVAANEPRVKGCIAYAPVTDVPGHLGAQTVRALNAAQSGTAVFLRRYSPHANVAKLRCPVFLFVAADDRNTPPVAVAKLAATLKKTNKRVTFVRVPSGGHYQSMIKVGIPKGIAWLNALQGKKPVSSKQRQ